MSRISSKMSRRQDDMRMEGGGSYIVSRERRSDLDDEEEYIVSHRGAREEVPIRSSTRRSLSPQHTVEGTRRAVVVREGREYEQIGQVRGGRVHGDQVMYRSPPIERGPKRAHVDERGFDVSPTSLEMRRKMEYTEYIDYDEGSMRSKHSYGYDDHVEGYNNPQDYSASRSGSGARNETIPVEDGFERDVQLLRNYRYATKYGDACTYENRLAKGSRNYSTVDMRKANDESVRYQDAITNEKLVKDVYYKDGEKSGYYTREGRYVGSSLSQIKDFENEALPKDPSSDIILRGEYVSKVRDFQTLPSDGYPKRYGKIIEPLVIDDYSQRTYSNSRRSYEAGCTDSKCYACDAYTYGRPGRKDYPYPEIGLHGNDDPSFSDQGNVYAKVAYVNGDHDERDFLRTDAVDRRVERMGKAECSHSSRRIVKNNGIHDLDLAQEEMALDYADSRRSSASLMQAGDYLDGEHSHAQLTRKVSDHDHISDYDCFHEHESEERQLGYGYGRYAGVGPHRTRLNYSTDLKNDMELQRFAGGQERMKDDRLVNNERLLKRKYISDEDTGRVDSRSVGRKWNMPTEDDDFIDHLEWTNRKASDMHQKRHSGFEQTHYYAEANQVFDETCHHKDSTNAGWNSYEDQSESFQEHYGKHFKMGSRHLKGYAKFDSSKSYSNSHHTNQRSNRYKQHNFRPRNEDDHHMVVAAQAANLSENSGGSWKREQEDSDGFKQRVQVAYLDFSKRFNENPTARKLYKEEGKAGSLFCVVCRRSVSKEFQDTRALATHAFMSHKVGLRPHHLGLHKAICVLMGWNIMPDPAGIWTPEVLPQAEALAQKEDLILWPPAVIIHNISLSYNDHNEWKLINIEALGEFLRGKGFHLGKMKICLGNPGDHSVILVKFLGTFSGLQEAERLHKYFLERKHGRLDLGEAISSTGKGCKSVEGDTEAEKLEDIFLYGYMGISEDLDRVDFDTKKRSSVKSKKEIHELADAPVQPK